MNSTTTAAPTTEALPDLPTAQRELDSLRAAREALKPEWQTIETRMGDGYRQAAAGLPVNPDDSAEIDALVSRERILLIQIKRAEEVLKRAETRAVIRAVLETELAVAAERDVYLAHSKKASEAFAIAAAHLLAMVPISHRMLDLTLRRVRGGNTLTDKGFISKGDLSEIARPAHLVTLIQRDLNNRLGFFPCEHSLAYGNPTLDISCAGAASLFMDAVDVLFDLPHADQAEIDAVRAEMLAESKGGVVNVGDAPQPAPSERTTPAQSHQGLSRFLELEEN